MPNISEFKNGMTVIDLKKLLDAYPETNSEGDPCEVWIGHKGLSSQAGFAGPLDKSQDSQGNTHCDLLLQ